jgi:prepilin-type N-terminal cleavage/methylation domain-containing protein
MRKSTSGFTIVELLVVIVVIAILAAITIVAYNGIQARAKTTSAASAASLTVKKAEIYNTEIGNYPLAMSNLTGASTTATYSLTGIVNGGTLTNNTPTNAVTYYACGTGSPANLAAITTSNISGGLIYYRDYAGSTNATKSAGTTSGSGVACYYSP